MNTRLKTKGSLVNQTDGAEMVYVSAGEFTMGASDLYNAPIHVVYLDAYWIYKNVVTVAQYRAFCNATGHGMPSAPSWGWRDDHPIVNVRWDDANAYAQWAGASLPTEAQWEKAARGTDGRQYPWGNDWNPDLCANSVSPNNLNGTKPVGSYPGGASPYGALDMAGNVWQWCSDWYDANYYTRSKVVINPTGARNPTYNRVLRGGSWGSDYPFNFRAAVRNWYFPTDEIINFGFRCAVRAD